MEQNRNVPLIFVTGVGQTWSTLQGSEDKWNLFPQGKKALPLTNKRRLMSLLFHALTDGKVSQDLLEAQFRSMFRYCRVDRQGNLPPQVQVRLYGPRSFETLSHIDFYTGEKTDDPSRSLLDRLLRDVPCRELMEQYGADRMFCFNYSPFTDLYAQAQNLRDFIDVVRRGCPDAGRVTLVPMSMGASIVLAYMDAYAAHVCDNVGAVLSVVGAWDGSEALADVLEGAVCDDWTDRFYHQFLPSLLHQKPLLRLLQRDTQRTDRLLRQLHLALLDTVLLRCSAFLAMVPYHRWETLYGTLFHQQRMLRCSRLPIVQRQADRFISAQKNLHACMTNLTRNASVRFFFLGGYGLDFGEGSRDFDFLQLTRSAGQGGSDGVLQISSAVPGTVYTADSVREDSGWFPQNSFYYLRQAHEIGDNPEAMAQLLTLAMQMKESV